MSRFAKVALDRVVGTVLLILAAPALVVIALLVVADSGRPALFVYPRAGKDGVPFRMFKFRTMIQNAIEAGREMRLTEDPFGVVAGDPRVTRVGRFLRRTGLDELPQLINVVRGEMSLVGPRADLVEQAAHYTERERRRLSVLPGITGWAQIHGRDSVPWPERFDMDIWYIDHWSPWLDVKIVARTFAEVLRADPEPIEDRMNIERARQASPPADR